MPPTLGFENVVCGYKKPVLRDLSLEVRAGEVCALLGPNGCGKTTLLKTGAGLLKPLAGAVFFYGKPVISMKPGERASFASILFQSLDIPWPFTVREIVSQGAAVNAEAGRSGKSGQKAVIEEALSRTNMLHLAQKPVTEISGGEAQRALIARSLAQGAKLLLLDEPVNSLDIRAQHGILRFLRVLASEQGIAVFLVLHDLNLAARYADRVIVLSGGSVYADGSPAQTLTDSTLREVFGVETADISPP